MSTCAQVGLRHLYSCLLEFEDVRNKDVCRFISVGSSSLLMFSRYFAGVRFLAGALFHKALHTFLVAEILRTLHDLATAIRESPERAHQSAAKLSMALTAGLVSYMVPSSLVGFQVLAYFSSHVVDSAAALFTSSPGAVSLFLPYVRWLYSQVKLPLLSKLVVRETPVEGDWTLSDTRFSLE